MERVRAQVAKHAPFTSGSRWGHGNNTGQVMHCEPGRESGSKATKQAVPSVCCVRKEGPTVVCHAGRLSWALPCAAAGLLFAPSV